MRLGDWTIKHVSGMISNIRLLLDWYRGNSCEGVKFAQCQTLKKIELPPLLFTSILT